MKKFAAAVLIISLLFTLAACGEKRVYKKVGITPSEIPETESVTDEPEATTEPESETETETESETESTPTTTRRRGGSINQPSTRPHAPVGGNSPSTSAPTPEVPTADILPTVPPSEHVPATVPSTNAPETAEPTQTEPEAPTDDFRD